MADKTKIANRILAKVGSQRITDYNDPNKEQARKIRDVFDQCYEQLLDEARWTSHLTQQSIARLVAVPVQKFAYYYQLPSDFLRPVEFNRVDIFDEPYTDYFDIHGDRLLTDAETVELTYIKKDLDTELLTPSMVTALVYLVASDVAISLRQDEGLSARMQDLYDTRYLPRAVRASAVKRKDRQWNPVAESRLVRARYQSTNG